MMMIAAIPGGCKSVVALAHALRMKVPTLYLAMDSDEHAMAIRTVQMAAGIESEEAERQIAERGILARQVAGITAHVQFDFPTGADVEELAHRVWAYAEKNGEFPHFVVVDNLMDVVHDEASEHAGAGQVLIALANMARSAKAAVMVLHHVNGEYENDPHRPIPMGGLNGKVSKKPATVLTMCRGKEDGQFWVSVVKNRSGAVDPSGFRVRIPLYTDLSRMQIRSNVET